MLFAYKETFEAVLAPKCKLYKKKTRNGDIKSKKEKEKRRGMSRRRKITIHTEVRRKREKERGR